MLHLGLDLCVKSKRIIVKKGTVILISVITLALGVIGTGLSTLLERNERIESSVIFKASYGFPLAWHGYSQNYSLQSAGWGPYIPPKIYWLSLGSLLLDAVFWFAISFFVCLAVVKSTTTVRKAASKILSVIDIVVMYFFASLSFLVIGLGLCLVTQTVYMYGFPGPNGISGVAKSALHPYLDLGLRLFGFGIFLVAATFYQTLVMERKTAHARLVELRNEKQF